MRRCVAVLVLLLVTPLGLEAASPSLTAIRPVGGQRGTELEITLSGARLGDAQEIIYYQPGITTVSLKKLDDNSVRAKIKIAPECLLGLHDVRLRTATGISELRTFSVGALKEINEIEPNNDFAAPQPIPMNVTVNGIADNEDVDYFVVEAKKGERISAEVEGLRLGISEFDPYVAIMDAKRFELGVSDDAALAWRDGFTAIIAPEDGKYIIQVRESAYAGNAAVFIACTWETSRGPRRLCRPGVSRVKPLRCAGSATRPVKRHRPSNFPRRYEREFGIERQDEKGFSPYPNAFRLSIAGKRYRKRAQRRPGARHAVHGPDGLERRDRKGRGRRPVRLQGHQGPGLRHSLLCPQDSVAARSGHVPREKGGGRDAGGRRLGWARQLFPVPGPRDGRIRRLAGRPVRQGRAGLCLPDRAHTSRRRCSP